MTKEEQVAYMTKKREEDWKELKSILANNDVEMLAKKAMDEFKLPADQREIVEELVAKWMKTKQVAEAKIRSVLGSTLQKEGSEFAELSMDERKQYMREIESMAEQKIAEFLQAMSADGARRTKDGYFKMSAEQRAEYDAKFDKFREYFESDEFLTKGWDDKEERSNRYQQRGRGGRDSDDSDDSDGRGSRGGRGDDSDSDFDEVIGKIKDILGDKDGGKLDQMIDLVE